MQKLTPIFVTTTVITGIMSAYLWQQLNTERIRANALQQRVSELELAQANPASAAAPSLVAQQPAAPAAGSSTAAATAQAGTPDAANPAPAAEGKRTREPGISINSDDLMKDPEYRAAMAPMLRQAMAQNYPDLAKELGISPQQAGKLLDIMANTALAGMSSSTGNSVADPRELAQAAAEARRKQEADVVALLGDAKAQQWKEYQETLPARQQISRLRTTLESSGSNLSERQQQQLIAAMTSEQKRRSAEMTQTLQVTGASSGNPQAPRDTVAMLEQELQHTEESNRRVQESAASYLTQQQLDALKTQQNQELQMTRALLRAQRSRSENGQVPGNAAIVIGGPTGRP